jgi:hypothetical protein
VSKKCKKNIIACPEDKRFNFKGGMKKIRGCHVTFKNPYWWEMGGKGETKLPNYWCAKSRNK